MAKQNKSEVNERNMYAYHAIMRSGAGQHTDKKHKDNKTKCRQKVSDSD